MLQYFRFGSVQVIFFFFLIREPQSFTANSAGSLKKQKTVLNPLRISGGAQEEREGLLEAGFSKVVSSQTHYQVTNRLTSYCASAELG